MDTLESRIARLERAARVQRVVIAILTALTVSTATFPLVRAQQEPETLRTRQLIIEDEAGRPRIRLGAPLPGSGTPRTGMRITDTRGFERFGVNLFDDGRMVMGLDAPPSPAGTPFVNPERINLVADNEGGGYIVLKDRRSFVVGRLYLDAENRALLEFSDFSRTPAVQRRLGLSVDDNAR